MPYADSLGPDESRVSGSLDIFWSENYTVCWQINQTLIYKTVDSVTLRSDWWMRRLIWSYTVRMSEDPFSHGTSHTTQHCWPVGFRHYERSWLQVINIFNILNTVIIKTLNAMPFYKCKNNLLLTSYCSSRPIEYAEKYFTAASKGRKN